jgi:TPP-dependent pyruvate/acetoin dehydrogenase alpha subunit
MNIPNHYKKVRDVKFTKQELISFEDKVKDAYENSKIKGPIHLSKNNEENLIELFQYIHPEDWVFSAWRNHYHALLHGVDQDKLFDWISEGRSMGTNNVKPNFYASSIVGGIIPIALGVAMGLKRNNSPRRVWCFIGDMTMETGIFWEAYKYSQNLNIPLQFVVEDNNLSVHTPTDITWGKRMSVPDNVIYYSYKMEYPHHGTGKWVNF